MPNELATRNGAQAPQDQSSSIIAAGLDIRQLGGILAKSGYFADAQQEAQAVVKVLYGQELGIAPIAAMTGIHVIEGKPSVGAHLIASAIKRSNKYDYRVAKSTDDVCELEFSELRAGTWQVLGTESLTIEQANKRGLTQGRSGIKDNWAKFACDMHFARCISRGYKHHCPDVFGGLLVYTEGETEETRAAEAKPVSSLQERLSAEPSASAIPEARRAAYKDLRKQVAAADAQAPRALRENDTEADLDRLEATARKLLDDAKSNVVEGEIASGPITQGDIQQIIDATAKAENWPKNNLGAADMLAFYEALKREGFDASGGLTPANITEALQAARRGFLNVSTTKDPYADN